MGLQFEKTMQKFIVLLVLLTLAGSAQADWWDDATNWVHEKVTNAADWMRDKASPTIREKFNEAKEKIQDPETHKKVQDWVHEEAVPVLKEKFDQFKTFINDDVVPEVQKVVEAGIEASKKREEEGQKVSQDED